MKKDILKKWILPISLFFIGLIFCIAGIYLGEIDDAPGASLIGFALMIGLFLLSIKVFRKYHR